MRGDLYLEKRLKFLWRNYFADVPRKHPVQIKFGREAKYRFGSIRYDYASKNVQIAINGRFRNEKYPQEIIDHTMAHEMVHYAQGFPTPGPRLHRYPHRGGVIDKELKSRHLIHLVIFYHSWVKNYIKNL
jgi:hypothetical protein